MEEFNTIDQYAVVDCTVTYGSNSGMSGYNSGNRISFMGNSFDMGSLSTGSNTLIFPYWNLAVISNNDILNPGGTRHCIKLHAPFRRKYAGNPNGAIGTPTATNRIMNIPKKFQLQI